MECLATANKQQRMAGPLWLAILTLLFTITAAQINVIEEKTCGEIKCAQYQYCRPIDHVCRDCSDICDERQSKYFHEDTCDQQCQDYLHDQKYLRKSESASSAVTELNKRIDRIEVIAIAALIISTILALIVGGVLVLCMQKKNLLPSFNLKKKKAEKARYPGDTPISTIRLPKPIPGINEAVRNNNPVPPPIEYGNFTTFRNPSPSRPDSTQPANAKTKPLEKRVASEDSELDFAYDNPAMTPSPVLNKGETTP